MGIEPGTSRSVVRCATTWPTTTAHTYILNHLNFKQFQSKPLFENRAKGWNKSYSSDPKSLAVLLLQWLRERETREVFSFRKLTNLIPAFSFGIAHHVLDSGMVLSVVIQQLVDGNELEWKKLAMMAAKHDGFLIIKVRAPISSHRDWESKKVTLHWSTLLN